MEQITTIIEQPQVQFVLGTLVMGIVIFSTAYYTSRNSPLAATSPNSLIENSIISKADAWLKENRNIHFVAFEYLGDMTKRERVMKVATMLAEKISAQRQLDKIYIFARDKPTLNAYLILDEMPHLANSICGGLLSNYGNELFSPNKKPCLVIFDFLTEDDINLRDQLLHLLTHRETMKMHIIIVHDHETSTENPIIKLMDCIICNKANEKYFETLKEVRNDSKKSLSEDFESINH